MEALALLGRVPFRFYVYAAIAALVGYLMWREHVLTRKLTAALVQIELVQEKLDAKERELVAERKNAEKARKASDDYQTELERLRAARADTPARVVRLCLNPADDVSEAASRPPEARAEGLPEAARSDHRAGPDIGGELYELVDEADQCAAQRDALINWYRNINIQ